MDDTVRSILRDILRRHGNELIREPERCENIFETLPQQAKLESAALIEVLRQGVPQRILDMPSGNLTRATLRNFATRVSQETGLREDVARWAVETWAFGLGYEIPGGKLDQIANGALTHSSALF